MLDRGVEGTGAGGAGVCCWGGVDAARVCFGCFGCFGCFDFAGGCFDAGVAVAAVVEGDGRVRLVAIVVVGAVVLIGVPGAGAGCTTGAAGAPGRNNEASLDAMLTRTPSDRDTLILFWGMLLFEYPQLGSVCCFRKTAWRVGVWRTSLGL